MKIQKGKGLAIGIIAVIIVSLVTVGIIIFRPQPDNAVYFTSIWDTTKTSSGSSGVNQIKLPLESSGTYNFIVQWGDGTRNTITSWDQAETIHTYATSGVYTMNISGTIIGWRFNNGGDRLKILNISRWGCLRLGNTDYYFNGCANLNMTPSDVLDLTGTTDLMGCFWGCSKLDKVPHMDEWDTSEVTNMSFMFWGATAFNQSIGTWDVSSVNNIEWMFLGTSAFNQSINDWDVSSVTKMVGMFDSASHFNQPLNNWDVSSVTTLSGMFEFANAFNQPLGDWNVSKVTNMAYLFYLTDFDQDLSDWNVSSVTTMEGMFEGASLSTPNYDSLLIAWSALTLQSNVKFHAGATTQYSAGAATTARGILTSTYSWTITDGGQVV